MIKQLNLIKPFWRRAGGILLAFILVLLLLSLVLSSYWKPILTKEIKDAIGDSTDSLYTIDFADVDVNLLTGNVVVQKIIFKPNIKVYNKLKAGLKAPRHLFEVKIEGLILHRTNPWRVYFRRKLEMNSIVIDRPRLTIYYEGIQKPDSTAEDKRTAYQRLSKYLKEVKINNIAFANADLKYVDKKDKRTITYGVDNLNIRIDDLLIDSLSQFDKSRFYYTKDISVQIPGHSFNTNDGMYTIKFNDLLASSGRGLMKLDGLQIIPRYTELQFTRKFKAQKDRYSMRFQEIELNNIDFKRLNTQRRLIAGSINIAGAFISIFLNRELPRPEMDKGRNYPHVALKRLELNTRIDSVNIKNTEIRYTEYNPKTAQRGTLLLTALNGTILNVTNDSLSLQKNKWSKAKITTLLMGAGAINMNLNLNLTDPSASFNFNGQLGQLNLRSLNKLIRPLAMMEVKSGIIEKATFSVYGNYRRATGTLKMHYNNLKIGILSKDEEDGKIKKRGLVSLLANVLLIENDNPSKDGSFRTGHIAYARPENGSFFNLMWKSVFSGVKESVGFTVEKERQMLERMEQKKDREERRAVRKKKRETKKK
jgi:hypothetical protein